MVLSNVSPFSGQFDPYVRDKLAIAEVIKLAIFKEPNFPKGTSLAGQDGDAVAADLSASRARFRTASVMLSRMCGRRAADFRGVVDTSNTDALSSAVSLTAKGVTFPAATMRTIKLRMVSTNNADSMVQEVEQDVWGNDGTTPKLGDARLLKAFKIASGTYQAMGRVHVRAASDGTEKTDDTNSAGSSIAALTNGTAVLTTPVARAARVLGVNFASDTYDATKGCVPHIAVLDGDGSARIDLGSADDGLVDTTPATGILDIAMELWPTAQCKLVLNSTAVEVHVNSSVNDVYRHVLEVEVGPAISNALSA